MIATIDRVQAQAADIHWKKVLLTLLAAIPYVIGFLIGLVLVVVSWMAAAVMVGMTDARRKGTSGGSG